LWHEAQLLLNNDLPSAHFALSTSALENKNPSDRSMVNKAVKLNPGEALLVFSDFMEKRIVMEL
jgi:hypothetical protein